MDVKDIQGLLTPIKVMKTNTKAQKTSLIEH